MFGSRVMGGEGASLFGFRTEKASDPGLVLFPIAASTAGMTLQTVEQIYQLAYERAQAALRPSRYDRMQAGTWN